MGTNLKEILGSNRESFMSNGGNACVNSPLSRYTIACLRAYEGMRNK